MKEKKKVWKPFLKFYTKFKIPWWLFILSLGCGLVYAEITLKIAEYAISINKGELYNGVIIGYVLLTVLNAVVVMGQNILSAYGTQTIIIRARLLLWHKILHLPMKDIEEKKPSSLISGVVNDVTQASVTISMLFLSGASIYGFTRACVQLQQYNASLTMYLLLLVPVAVLVFFFVGRLQFKMYRKQFKALNSMTEFFSEHLSAAKHVKAQSMEEREIEEGLAVIEQRYKADIYFAVMSTVQVLLNSIYTNLSTIVMAVGGSAMIREGKMESTGINTFSTYMQRVNQYMAEILTQYQNIKGAQGALRTVNGLLETPEETQTGQALPACDDIIFDAVSFGYTKNSKVLDEVSFTIPLGKTTALVGNNGSGKSTVLKLLQRFYSPQSGRILIGNADLAETQCAAVREKFGYVLQDNPLLAGSIRDNITYGMQGEISDETVIHAAKLADAHDFIAAMPNGYDTDVGESGSRLSGGQKQRVALARVMMRGTEYLLLDEAGASLDYKTAGHVFNAVKENYKGKTVVLIAHDMEEVVTADHIIVLNKGRVEAAGAHEQLLQSSPTYKQYVGQLEKTEVNR